MNSDTVKARRLHLDDDFWTVSGGSLYIDTRGEGYELGSREGDAILKAVGRDLTAGNWGDYDWFSGDSGSSYAMDLGLDFESADRERYDWISVHVTPAMTETVDCLERLGLGDEGRSRHLPAAVSGGLWGGRLLPLAGGSAHG